jgi:AcrR family transcriptional regulator
MLSNFEPMSDDDPLLPPWLELAWGRRRRATRGPKPRLTLESIVAAGIAVAMTEGIGALSMTRVAAKLGVGTMSLYRYVSSKDELLTLLVDTALGSPPQAPPGDDWRSGLTRWAVGVRTAYQRHPWALRVPISAPPLGPNNVSWLENALVALRPTPLSEQEKLSTVLLVSGFVRNEATLGLDLAAGAAAAGAGEGQVMPTYARLLSSLIEPGDFPALEDAIASGALADEDDPDSEFQFGLERILDGVAALITAHEA